MKIRVTIIISKLDLKEKKKANYQGNGKTKETKLCGLVLL